MRHVAASTTLSRVSSLPPPSLSTGSDEASAIVLAPHLVTEVPGPESRALATRLAAAECPAAGARRLAREEASGEPFAPIVYREGRGANVWDVDGNRYVDFVAGFGALSFGHGAPFIARAARAQEERLGLALGDVYGSDVKVEVLEALRALHWDREARVMLGLSGADATTAALKTAALASGKAGVIAFEGAYHGLSHGPLAACGLKESFRAPFAGQTGGFVQFAPFPTDAAALARSLAAVRTLLARGDVGAVLVEPILGRGGVVVPPPDFLPELRTLAHEKGALLVADEIWTGLGRSGAALASEAARPDIVCVGKALGGGHAISAAIGSGAAMAAWGAHGGATLHTATHFGAPPACAAALAVLERMRHPGFLEDIERRGLLLRAALLEHLADRVRDVRGRGLMIGVGLRNGAEALAVMQRMLRRGYIVLTGGVQGDVLTLTPPLDVHESAFEPFARALAASLAEVGP